MDLRIAYDRHGSGLRHDVDTPVEASIGAAHHAHAVALGSVIAVCGTPAPRVTERPWPPRDEEPCPRCIATVGGFTGFTTRLPHSAEPRGVTT
jgi:hypothetical protein